MAQHVERDRTLEAGPTREAWKKITDGLRTHGRAKRTAERIYEHEVAAVILAELLEASTRRNLGRADAGARVTAASLRAAVENYRAQTQRLRRQVAHLEARLSEPLARVATAEVEAGPQPLTHAEEPSARVEEPEQRLSDLEEELARRPEELEADARDRSRAPLPRARVFSGTEAQPSARGSALRRRRDRPRRRHGRRRARTA